MAQSQSCEDSQSLLKEYARFCNTEGLPHFSVEELLSLDNLTADQRDWLNAFLLRWGQATSINS
jgi:hypothetical protein